KLAKKQPWSVAHSAVLAWVQASFEGWHCHISPEQIEDLARELGIDVKRQWKLTREFLELHNKAQLEQLVRGMESRRRTCRSGPRQRQARRADRCDRSAQRSACPESTPQGCQGKSQIQRASRIARLPVGGTRQSTSGRR